MLVTPERREKKAIQSAFAVAALRAASTREPDPELANPDDFARHYLSLPHRILMALPHFVIRRLVERAFPGSYAYFLARTRFVDGCLEAALGGGARQVVLLGAGCDSRPQRFARALADLSVFELDLPATQAVKRERLRRLGIDPLPSLRYVPLDLNERPLTVALGEAGFDPERRTFFIWEGVSYYLEEQSVLGVLDFVARECREGSSIVFDYALEAFVRGDDSTYGGREIRRWLERNDEPFRFGLAEGALEGLLEERGLALLRDIGPEEITTEFLTRASGERIGRPLGHLRLAYAERPERK